MANKAFDATPETELLKGEEDEQIPKLTSVDAESQIVAQESTSHQDKSESSWKKTLEFFHDILEELMAPPTIGAVSSFFIFFFFFDISPTFMCLHD